MCQDYEAEHRFVTLLEREYGRCPDCRKLMIFCLCERRQEGRDG